MLFLLSCLCHPGFSRCSCGTQAALGDPVDVGALLTTAVAGLAGGRGSRPAPETPARGSWAQRGAAAPSPHHAALPTTPSPRPCISGSKLTPGGQRLYSSRGPSVVCPRSQGPD